MYTVTSFVSKSVKCIIVYHGGTLYLPLQYHFSMEYLLASVSPPRNQNSTDLTLQRARLTSYVIIRHTTSAFTYSRCCYYCCCFWIVIPAVAVIIDVVVPAVGIIIIIVVIVNDSFINSHKRDNMNEKGRRIITNDN